MVPRSARGIGFQTMAAFKESDHVRPIGNVSHAGEEGIVERQGLGYAGEDGPVEQFWVKFPNGDSDLYDSDNLLILDRLTQEDPTQEDS
jgi:hypothetical protein